MLTHLHRNDSVTSITIGVENETEKSKYIEILGYNSMFRKPIEGIKIVNLSDHYGDDDDRLTLLQNYINAVGHIGIVLTRFQSDNERQMIQFFEVKETSYTGQQSILPINPFNYLSQGSFSKKISDAPVMYNITPNVSFGIDILSFTHYSITMFIGNNKRNVIAETNKYYTEVMKAYENSDPNGELPIMYTEEEKNNLLFISK